MKARCTLRTGRLPLLSTLLSLTLVAATPSSIFAAGAGVMFRTNPPAKSSDSDLDIFRGTQAALIRSPFVLKRALADPKLRELASAKELGNGGDTVAWLRSVVSVDLPKDATVFEIRVNGDGVSQPAAKQIVEAVATAYTEEVILAAKAEQLRPREILIESAAKLRRDIARKSTALNQMKRDYEAPGETKTRLLVAQIGRLEAEVLRLEDRLLQLEIDTAGDDAENDADDDGQAGRATKLINGRVAVLHSRIDELTGEAVRADEEVSDIELRESEIKNLRKVLASIQTRIQASEIEAQQPLRIERVPGVRAF